MKAVELGIPVTNKLGCRGGCEGCILVTIMYRKNNNFLLLRKQNDFGKV